MGCGRWTTRALAVKHGPHEFAHRRRPGRFGALFPRFLRGRLQRRELARPLRPADERTGHVADRPRSREQRHLRHERHLGNERQLGLERQLRNEWLVGQQRVQRLVRNERLVRFERRHEGRGHGLGARVEEPGRLLQRGSGRQRRLLRGRRRSLCCARYTSGGDGPSNRTFECVANGAAACVGGQKIACDDRTDCPSGQVCCGAFDNNQGYRAVQCAASCNAARSPASRRCASAIRTRRSTSARASARRASRAAASPASTSASSASRYQGRSPPRARRMLRRGGRGMRTERRHRLARE